MQTTFCTVCSNGCRLVATTTAQGTTVLSGNRCAQGLAHARRHWPLATIIQSSSPHQSPPAESVLREVAQRFSVHIKQLLPRVAIQGSPERSRFRIVVEAAGQQRYLVEQIEPAQQQRREQIASFLDTLAAAAVKVIPYCRTAQGEAVLAFDGSFWMVSTWLRGQQPDRATLWQESWRGEALGAFLLSLHQASASITDPAPPFNLPDYIDSLLRTIHRHHPRVGASLAASIAFVKDGLYGEYERLPKGFCHGDSHPLNMLWDSQGIVAALDWEFCGIKPRLYDRALLYGCVGVEHPQAIGGRCLEALGSVVQRQMGPTALEQRLFAPLAVGLRFGWLAEWLRREDWEMVDFELNYMRHLQASL
jgi:homoserine kinase type II